MADALINLRASSVFLTKKEKKRVAHHSKLAISIAFALDPSEQHYPPRSIGRPVILKKNVTFDRMTEEDFHPRIVQRAYGPTATSGNVAYLHCW